MKDIFNNTQEIDLINSYDDYCRSMDKVNEYLNEQGYKPAKIHPIKTYKQEPITLF